VIRNSAGQRFGHGQRLRLSKVSAQDLPIGTGSCPTGAIARAMQNTQSWADIPVEVAEEPIYPAGSQLSGRLCSIWNCSITVDPSIGWPSSTVDLNSRTSPKPCVLTSAKISWAWSSVA
jgi:hypothetical protein